MARDCGGEAGDGVTCVPGCAPVGLQCLSVDCGCWDCSFPPSHFGDALQTQINNGVPSHNEVIVDPASIQANLPRAVLAFFYEEEKDAGSAGGYRDTFLRDYGIVLPLLRLDLNAEVPFSYSSV